MNKNNNTLNKIYDNYRIFHPDGTLLSFCSHKKANWYVKKQLGILKDKDVHLTFKPNGYGDPEEILIGRENKCVVSGDTENLTKHHVIPYMFRKHFPLQYKDKNSCDIVLLTREIHNQYEEEATKLKIKLITDFVDPFLIEQNDMWSICKKRYNTMINNYDKLPHDKQVFIKMSYEGLIDKYKFDPETFDKNNVKYTITSPYLDLIYNEVIVNVGILNLLALWKLHFIEVGKPKYLPDWWKWDSYKKIKNGITDKETTLSTVRKTKKLNNLITKYI
jgi:hypothetical protein